uniref:hypothetical protein n=1 Tax=Streptomyces clavuligerus TaxID=1901 RepID=UPI0027DD0AA0
MGDTDRRLTVPLPALALAPVLHAAARRGGGQRETVADTGSPTCSDAAPGGSSPLPSRLSSRPDDGCDGCGRVRGMTRSSRPSGLTAGPDSMLLPVPVPFP